MSLLSPQALNLSFDGLNGKATVLEMDIPQGLKKGDWDMLAWNKLQISASIKAFRESPLAARDFVIIVQCTWQQIAEVSAAFQEHEVSNPQVHYFIDDRTCYGTGPSLSTGVSNYVVIGFGAKVGKGKGAFPGQWNYDFCAEDRHLMLTPFRFFPVTRSFSKYGLPELDSWLTYSWEGQTVFFNKTQKSFEEMRWLIRHYSRPGEVVVSYCAGTCTTAVAACFENRHSVSVELDPTKSGGRYRMNIIADHFNSMLGGPSGSCSMATPLKPVAAAAGPTALSPGAKAIADLAARQQAEEERKWDQFYVEKICGGDVEDDEAAIRTLLNRKKGFWAQLVPELQQRVGVDKVAKGVDVFKAYVFAKEPEERHKLFWTQDTDSLRTWVEKAISEKEVRLTLGLGSKAV